MWTQSLLWLQSNGVAVTAIATVVYTIGTLFLWYTTKKSLDLLRRSNYGVILQMVTENHRELMQIALNDHELQKSFMPESINAARPELFTSKVRLFATALINHAEFAFLQTVFQTLPKSFEEGFCKDIKSIFQLPAIQMRWPEMRMRLEPSFRSFGDDALKGARENEITKSQQSKVEPQKPE